MNTKLKQSFLVGIGAGVEYYDFAIFAFFATELGKAFFPDISNNYATLYAFLIFFAGYMARPIGGYVFGIIGDKYGRKSGFLYTMLTLIITTFLMAILPSASNIGVFSTIVFITLRCLQGMAIGGEIPTATTFVVEHGEEKSGLYSSILYSGIMLGIVMTSTMYYILSRIDIEQYTSIESWRIAFLIGVGLTCASFIFRKTLKETDIFKQCDMINNVNGIVLNNKNTIACILILSGVAMLTTQLVIFMPTYLTNYISLEKEVVGNILLISSLLMIPSCILSGLLSSHINKQKLFTIYMVILSFSMLLMYSFSNEIHLMIIFIMISSIIYGMLPSTYPVILAKAFSIKSRCKGIGFSYNMAYSIFSAPIPATIVWLLSLYNSPFILYFLLLVSFFISAVGLTLFNKNLEKAKFYDAPTT